MEAVYANGLCPVFFFCFQCVNHMNPFDHQYASIFFNIAACLQREQAVTGRNVARLQRAPEGSDQSPGRRRNHIIERGRVRVQHIGINTVVLGDL